MGVFVRGKRSRVSKIEGMGRRVRAVGQMRSEASAARSKGSEARSS